jgi:DNA-binding transcriptional LysR family regulator
MTSAQLQAFVTLAQTNSFTSAAMMLGITQSAVSHAIKSLEDELGVSLFVRGKAEIVLTEVGKDLVGPLNKLPMKRETCSKGYLELAPLAQAFQ